MPHVVERLKVVVGRGVIAGLTPDALLNVEARLIGWEILEVQIAVRREKGVHLIAAMPHGAVDVQPDSVAAERAPKVAQGHEKALVVAMRLANQPPPPQQRSDPPEDVQALPMGTARGHPQSLSALRPAPSQAGVQREARFVFEDNGLASGQCGEPFFRLCRNCRASSARAWT